jgi:hypothetical protein
VAVEARVVREAREDDPPISALDRSDHRVAAHERDRESNDASNGRLRTNARGFHHPEALITVALLDRAGVAPDLPWNQVA